MKFFLCVMGMVLIFEGLPYFAIPGRLKLWLRSIIELPEHAMRKIGFVFMVAGLFLIYLGKG